MRGTGIISKVPIKMQEKEKKKENLVRILQKPLQYVRIE